MVQFLLSDWSRSDFTVLLYHFHLIVFQVLSSMYNWMVIGYTTTVRCGVGIVTTPARALLQFVARRRADGQSVEQVKKMEGEVRRTQMREVQ